MDIIENFGAFFYRENPETHEIETKDSVAENQPILTLDIINRLDPEVGMNLEFKIGIQEYKRMFTKEMGFSTMDAMNMVKPIFDKMLEHQTANRDYIVINGANCVVLVKSGTTEDAFVLNDQRLMTQVEDTLVWMHAQDKYLA